MDTEAVLELLRDVAAEVITPRFRALADHQVSEKNPGDLVTVADHEAEVLITAALQRAHPDAVVLGEEAASRDPSLMDAFAAADHAFTVDPVDGTKNFVHGSSDHAVMVGETRDGVAVRSWIWQPQHETAYVAERGAGSWRNGDPLRITRDGATDAPYRTARRRWVGRELTGLGTLALTWACCGVDYPNLVRGEARAIVYHHSKPWDHVPGSLLLAEAGGYLGFLDGTPYDVRKHGDGLVGAADRTTYDAVVAALAGA